MDVYISEEYVASRRKERERAKERNLVSRGTRPPPSPSGWFANGSRRYFPGGGGSGAAAAAGEVDMAQHSWESSDWGSAAVDKAQEKRGAGAAGATVDGCGGDGVVFFACYFSA